MDQNYQTHQAPAGSSEQNEPPQGEGRIERVLTAVFYALVVTLGLVFVFVLLSPDSEAIEEENGVVEHPQEAIERDEPVSLRESWPNTSDLFRRSTEQAQAARRAARQGEAGSGK